MSNRTLFLIALISLFTITIAGARTYKESAEPTADKVLTGTSGNDTLNRGNGNDNIRAGAGDDRIISGAGNDLVSGGAGNDKIKDGPGDDYVIGGAGNDTVIMGSGNDYINLGPGDDTLVINMAKDIGKLNFADGGEGDDTVIFVSEDMDEILNNEIAQYYENEKVYGKKIVDMGSFNVAAGLTGFEKVGFAASYTF